MLVREMGTIHPTLLPQLWPRAPTNADCVQRHGANIPGMHRWRWDKNQPCKHASDICW